VKISNEQSREVYILASDPAGKLTNSQIGARFGISESSVRHHIRKHEAALHKISQNNVRAAAAIAAHAVNLTDEAALILRVVKSGIQQAKTQGVSPERISPLYNNWIKILEMLSDMDIIRRIEKLEAKK